jgi:hypothetical protein
MTTKSLPKPEFSPFLYGTTVRSAIIMYDFGLDAELGFKKGKGPYLGTFSKLLLRFPEGEMVL